jgi:hypothetical protein
MGACGKALARNHRTALVAGIQGHLLRVFK